MIGMPSQWILRSTQQPTPAGRLSAPSKWAPMSVGRMPSATAPHPTLTLRVQKQALKYPAPAALERNRLATKHLLRSRRYLRFRITSSQQQPGGHQPHHHHRRRRRRHQAMDLFPDGGFVRLQNRVTSMYVYAEGDWEKVSMRASAAVPSLDEVWRVQHWASPLGHIVFVLLQNAAYGRYLSFGVKKAPRGHRGYRTTQLDRSEPHVLPLGQNVYPWTWAVQRLDPPDQNFVSLRYCICYLRANGRYLSWNNRVTAEGDPNAPRVSTMMQWTVHGVDASAAPVPRPLPHPVTLTHEDEGNDSALVFPHPPRIIRLVRANDEGEFDDNDHNWPSFAIYDDSLNNLRHELRLHQKDWNDDVSYTMCMRPGSHGRLMPLVTDLPRSLDPVSIVVFRTGSPAAAALEYPTLPPPPPPQDAAAA